MRFLLRSLMVLVLVPVAPAAAQPHLLAVLGGTAVQADDGGAVVEIDPTTGVATPLATPLPGEGLTGIAALPNGRVYVSTADISGPAQLLEVDAQTGALLAVVGPLSDGAIPVILHDLAADPTTGVLYGISIGADRATDGFASNALFTIDPATALATYVATPTGLAGGFMAIAFANDGTLWGKVTNSPELYELDKTTGAILSTVTLTPALGGLGLGNVGDDTFYMSECCASIPGNVLYRVDRLTGAATLIGAAGGNRRVHDFVVAGGLPSIVEIPTLGGRGLAILATVLLAAGGVLLRRRRDLGAAPRRPAA